MTGGKSYLKQQTLASFEGMLDRERFVRIHRSYIVNLDRASSASIPKRATAASRSCRAAPPSRSAAPDMAV